MEKADDLTATHGDALLARSIVSGGRSGKDLRELTLFNDEHFAVRLTFGRRSDETEAQ